MSRIRQIKPSWFLDKELRRGTSADARELYIGLWMLADDAGWFVWDVERIAAELYPYEGTARRERNVDRWARSLESLNPTSPHLVIYTCGHAAVPKMAAHQRIAGTKTLTTKARHQDCRDPRSRVSLQEATEAIEPDVATRSHGTVEVGVSNGTVGNGSSARAPEGGAPLTEWQRRVDRKVALGGKVPA